MTDALARTLGAVVPQTEAASELQVENSAGGFSFAVSKMTKLERFLILGTDGGTYYSSEKDLTKQNIDVLKELTNENPKSVVDMAVAVSVNGRAFKNNTALFALAYVLTFGNDEAKSYARTSVNKVARTSTHLFLFNKYLKLLAPGTGLGTSRNRAIAAWYEDKTAEELAYQAVKYRQREGWSHRDAMRQSRPKGIDHDLASWILEKRDFLPQDLPPIIYGFHKAQEATNVKEIVDVLTRYKNLPWEAVPTQFHKEPEVWRTLFYNGQLNGQALVRNITRLAKINAFDNLTFTVDYANKLKDEYMIRRARLHPINFLNALIVHSEGQFDRRDSSYYGFSTRNKTWTTVPQIIDALNAGYKSSFVNVEPSDKRILIGVDVSGSMSSASAAGMDLSAAQVAGAMASIIAKTEPYYRVMGFANQFTDLGITADMPLNEVFRRVQMNNFGTTDCSLPMTWALKNRLEFDTFVVITDNETYAGNKHPHVALKDYRKLMGIEARLIVVSAVANEFSIADPTDSGMLDIVGADTNLPKLISDFSAGRV